MKEVLFVCTGNTCRSPMAQVLAAEKAAEKGLNGTGFSSAGINSLIGMPASPGAIEACRMHGLELSGHRSRPLDRKLIRQAVLILTMEARHRDMITRKYGGARKKTYTLYEYVRGTTGNIADPFGGDIGEYVECFREIEKLLEEMLNSWEEKI